VPTLFDDFSSSVLSPVAWSAPYSEAQSDFEHAVVQGELHIQRRSGSTPAGYEFHLLPSNRRLSSAVFFQATMSVDREGARGFGFVKIQHYAQIPGGTWWTQCRLGNHLDAAQVTFLCDVYRPGPELEYTTDEVLIDFDTPLVAAIEIEPETMQLHFFLDGELIGEHTPLDAARLRNADFEPVVGLWTSAEASISARIDEVWITQP
jgi:hypothetical protein